MLRHREGVSFIDLQDILLVQREDRATVLYTADGGRYVTGDSLAEMEERRIVGPFEGSKPRQLLITREQWQAIKDGAPISSEPVEEEIP